MLRRISLGLNRFVRNKMRWGGNIEIPIHIPLLNGTHPKYIRTHMLLRLHLVHVHHCHTIILRNSPHLPLLTFKTLHFLKKNHRLFFSSGNLSAPVFSLRFLLLHSAEHPTNQLQCTDYNPRATATIRERSNNY